ncbi:tetratricopeptide repeat-containing sensor histidine kinase [Mariniflexile sp.]|uniref:tetratricopeptide repeat-containing sensor histidine kinase n=3 Tax=Mariniflexile sp. TaxID=1979402 RepID=UPI00404705F2
MKKTRLFFISVFLGSVLNCFCQQKSIEQLQSDIDKASSEESKVDAINKLGDHWFDRNYDSAIYYYNKANKISNSIDYKKGVFDHASKLGNVYLFQGNYGDLKKLMEASIIKAKRYNDKHYEAMYTTNLGNAYMYNSEYENALLYFQKGIDLFNANKEFDYERKINIFISICFFNSSNFDKSIAYSKLALQQSDAAKDSLNIVEALEYISNGYIEKNEFSQAKPYLERAIKLAKTLELPDKIASSQYLLSRVFAAEKAYPKAIEYAKKALEYYDATGNIFYKINVLTFLSTYYKDLKDYDKSLEYIKQAEQLAESNQMKSHLLLVYKNMAELNNDIQNYKDAYRYLEKHDVLNDSLNSIDLKNKLQGLDVQYETQKKELQIQSLQQQNTIKTLQNKRRFWISLVLVIVIISLSVFAYYQFRNFRIKKALLSEQQKTAIVEERLRIASEMHDDVGSGLSRIRYIIGAIYNGKTEQKEGLEKITEISDDSVQKMKEIIWSLNESNQNLEELIYYIRGQMSELTENAQIHFESYLPENIPTLFFGWARNRNTYLLVKETVHNAIKHADATKITLEFEISNDLIITISDNGRGFDTNLKHSGNGLNNYKKRISELKGNYKITSELSKGTTVTFQIPLTY